MTNAMLWSTNQTHKQRSPFKVTDGWYQALADGQFEAHEAQQFRQLLPRIVGFHLLWLGSARQLDWLTHCSIAHRVVMRSVLDDQLRHVSGAYEALPFASDSIDAVVLPHTLEFHNKPQQVIEEATRVLIPEGQIIILGFNPYSWLGLFSKLRRRSYELPWDGRFLSCHQIKQWLAAQSCQITDTHYYFYRPPLQHKSWLQRLQLLESIGPYCMPGMGGAYMIVARKKVASITPIKPRWQSKKLSLEGNVMGPTSRNTSHGDR